MVGAKIEVAGAADPRVKVLGKGRRAVPVVPSGCHPAIPIGKQIN